MLYHDGHNDLKGLQDICDRTIAKVTEMHRNGMFDGIVVTGHSGVIVGIPVHLMTGIPLTILRKDNENCHNTYSHFIGMQHIPGDRFLFLDDLIDSGETRFRVYDEIKSYNEEATFVGSYEYAHDYFSEGLKDGYWANGFYSEDNDNYDYEEDF